VVYQILARSSRGSGDARIGCRAYTRTPRQRLVGPLQSALRGECSIIIRRYPSARLRAYRLEFGSIVVSEIDEYSQAEADQHGG
jgi:hypothetical protein